MNVRKQSVGEPEYKTRLDAYAARQRLALLTDDLGRKVGYEMAREELLARQLGRYVATFPATRMTLHGQTVAVHVLDSPGTAG